MKILALATMALVVTAPIASAATITKTSSYLAGANGSPNGEPCADFVAGSGAFGNCNEIVQGNGNATGVFSLTIDGLVANPITDGTIRIQSSNADLGNNAVNRTTGLALEHFALEIDDIEYGVLYSPNVPVSDPGLAAAVLASPITTGSNQVLDLTFTIERSILSRLVADGTMTAFFDFSRSFPSTAPGSNVDNVNSFRNARFTVTYDVADVAPVPVPAAGFLLLAGLGGFAALRRRKG